MDDRWDERVKEYGAINITGFRIIDTERPIVQQFFRTWEGLDPAIYPGAGKPFISVKKHRIIHIKYMIQTCVVYFLLMSKKEKKYLPLLTIYWMGDIQRLKRLWFTTLSPWWPTLLTEC